MVILNLHKFMNATWQTFFLFSFSIFYHFSLPLICLICILFFKKGKCKLTRVDQKSNILFSVSEKKFITCATGKKAFLSFFSLSLKS